MFVGCPKLRLEYLKIRKQPKDHISSRKTALKMTQLLKLNETIPFETLYNCIVYGDHETHDHLVKHAAAYNVLVECMHTQGYKARSLLCLRILGYNVDWLFDSSENSDSSSFEEV